MRFAEAVRHVAELDRKIAQCRERVTRMRKLIADTAQGQPEADQCSMLSKMERHLGFLQQARKAFLRRVAQEESTGRRA